MQKNKNGFFEEWGEELTAGFLLFIIIILYLLLN